MGVVEVVAVAVPAAAVAVVPVVVAAQVVAGAVVGGKDIHCYECCIHRMISSTKTWGVLIKHNSH